MKVWIARDLDNTLILYRNKPLFDSKSGCWRGSEISEYNALLLDENCYPEIKKTHMEQLDIDSIPLKHIL